MYLIALCDDELTELNKTKLMLKNYTKKHPEIDFTITCFQSADDLIYKIGEKNYNYNTLEPKLLKANSLNLFNLIFGTQYANEDDLRKYMKHNKTECAMAIFNTSETIVFPNYIMEAISDNE